MYIGQYLHTLDNKNRIFLPARFRKKNKKFVLTRGLESCLYLYDLSSWEKVLEKLENLSLADKQEERAFKRALLSGAHEAVADSQGRILVPQTLRSYAQIKENEVMIIGVGNRLEFWDKSSWNEYYNTQAEVSFKNLAGKLDI